MWFRFVKKVDHVVNYYGQQMKTGDVVEFAGHFAQKAERNPDFETAEAPKKKAPPKKAAKKAVKKTVKKKAK